MKNGSSVSKVVLVLLLFISGASADDVVNDEGRIDLFSAAKYEGYKEIIRLNQLLVAGADITGKDKDGMSAIHLAAKYNSDPKVIELLVDHGADINSIASADSRADGDDFTGTPLYYALCYNPNYKVVELLLDMEQRRTVPIYRMVACAARNPNAEVVNKLYDVLINELLLEASVNSNTAVMDKFMQEGANINAVYHGGSTSPLYAAIRANNYNGVEYLVRGGANLGARYRGRQSALLVAADNSMNNSTSKIISFLLNYGAYVNEIDENGNTALHLAVKRATEIYKSEYNTYPLSAIEELICNFADVTIKNFAGETPLDYARKHRENLSGEDNLSDEVIRILQRAETEYQNHLTEMQACG